MLMIIVDASISSVRDGCLNTWNAWRTCIVSAFIIYVMLNCTGELGYDGPLYDRFLHMTDDMLGPSPMHIEYSSYVYDRFCI